MRDHVERVATAALFHDIGKFWSRTGAERPYTQQEADHFGTYAHALWSAAFVERRLGDSEMAGWVRAHHAVDTRESLLISLADWLSSGEREKDEDQATGPAAAAALESPLQYVARDDTAAGNGPRWVLPLTGHSDLGLEFMPRQDAGSVREKYASLWKGFTEAAKALFPDHRDHTTCLALLREFTARVPAATPTRVGAYIPDISLYDHARATAALAACFVAGALDETQVREVRSALTGKSSGHPALAAPLCQLACGDLSGIQDFLYSIVSEGAARTLRGRSFALQLLAEGIAHHLLERAGVPASCLLFSGGGRFYLLLPRDVDVQALAADAARAVHEGLRGDLAVHAAAVPLRAGDFFEGRMAAKWGEVGLVLGDLKRRRYTALAESDYVSVFGVTDEGGFKGRCEVCGCECDADTKTKCPDCEEYERLGQELGTASALLRTEADPPRARGINRVLAPLGFEYHLVGDQHSTPHNRVLEAQMLGAYNPARFLNGMNLCASAAVTRRWAARAWPRNGNGAGSVRTFKELAAASTGIPKLGVLRADVDNLGQLFATGLGKRATLSRVASLSSALGDFFEGYLPDVAQGDYPHTVGVLYAGGDDLFVVGAWSEVIDFAVHVREDFARFCCENPAFTLSGGVAIIDDHLPLRHAARLAGDAEEAAKHFTRDDKREKDALTLFDTPIGFEEFGRFRDFHELLMELLGEGGLPQSFLRRLFDIWETYKAERDHLARQHQNGKLSAAQLKRVAQWQRWRWMLTYGLREFSKKHKDKAEHIEDVQRRVLDDGPGRIEDRLGVPLRWTELKLRKEG